MEEEYSTSDTNHLLQSATDFSSYPGGANEVAVKEFLDRFPLPVLISSLQTKADVPGLEKALVACLERIFRTKYGSSLIPQYMPFLQVGLQAGSQSVKRLACITVSCLFENLNHESALPSHLIIGSDIYPLLLECLINGDEQVATAAVDAIKNFASSPEGIATIFPGDHSGATDLGQLASKCSSLGRIRVLSLIVKLFSVSRSVASVIHSSNLLSLMEAEIGKTKDMLSTLNVLELLYELAEVEHAAEFLPKTSLLQLLKSLISDSSADSILRTRAIMISGRLLSRDNIFSFADESSVLGIISGIEGRLQLFESIDDNECESALEAIGQLGSSAHGAELLLLRSPEAVKFLSNTAFNRQRRDKQLAALHSLANVAGANRSGDSLLLKREAEESLRRLIYETASMTSKLTPSGLLLLVLQQESEIRLAGYRLIASLVAREWCLMEICSRQDIVNTVTDAHIESTKIGMEARHNCCLSIQKALSASNNLKSDSVLVGISTKLVEAIKRGPYLARKQAEAQPAIMTEQRF